MKFRLLTSIMALLTSTFVFSQGIEFEHGTFQDALNKAKTENKLVFMDCYTSWCGPCKQMAKNVFTQKEVGDFFNSNFVNIKVDYDKGEGPELKKKYPASGYPTFLFIAPDGKMMHKVVGAMDAPTFLQKTKNALDPNLWVSTLKEKFNNGNRDMDFLMDYFTALKLTNNEDKACIVAREIVANSSIEKFMNKEAFEIIEAAQFTYESNEFKYLLKHRESALSFASNYAEYNLFRKPIRNYLIDYVQECKNLSHLVTEINKCVSEYDKLDKKHLIIELKPKFFLAKNQINNWYDARIEALDLEVKQQGSYAYKVFELGDEIYENPKLSSANEVIENYSEVAHKLMEKEENLVIGSLILAKLYLHKGDKEKAMKHFNYYDEHNYKSGKPQPAIVALKKAIEAL